MTRLHRSSDEHLSRRASFVVRVSRDGAGRLSGVVERVRTGEKRRFQDLDAVSRLIARMLDDESDVVHEEDEGESDG